MGILWINGAFGAGKSSVGATLVEMLPDAVLFDPEEVGFMLKRILPAEHRPEDFQDLRLWRELTVQTVLGLVRDLGRPLILPMTLVGEASFDGIVGELGRSGIEFQHVSLIASRETLRTRLEGRRSDSASLDWALARVDRCVAALASPLFARHVPTDDRPILEIARDILAHLPPRFLERRTDGIEARFAAHAP